MNLIQSKSRKTKNAFELFAELFRFPFKKNAFTFWTESLIEKSITFK